tara:strand:- start:1153 stop:1575 length:423 start_codon:yes stop_codon:yes gene_type:complete
VNEKIDFNNIGLLILRVTTGMLMLVNHGFGKILAGKDRWEKLGNALTDLIGFPTLNVFFGFMASFAESIGAILIAIGLFTRSASVLLFITMLVAIIKHFKDNEFAELAFIYWVLCLVFMMTGPGKLSVDNFFLSKIKNKK